jgi:hypothetical protein
MEERIVVADPTADPLGYQREVLGLLGGRDPLAVLAETPGEFRERTAGLQAELLGRRPESREWSVEELLGHLWDAELAWSFRARAILAQDGPVLVAFDQNAWATLTRPSFADLLDAFAALRGANLALVRGTPDADWERFGLHEERGPTSFRLLVQTAAGHDLAHRLQLERTLRMVAG